MTFVQSPLVIVCAIQSELIIYSVLIGYFSNSEGPASVKKACQDALPLGWVKGRGKPPQLVSPSFGKNSLLWNRTTLIFLPGKRRTWRSDVSENFKNKMTLLLARGKNAINFHIRESFPLARLFALSSKK
jgi:signal recognition particle receptor subunit beta